MPRRFVFGTLPPSGGVDNNAGGLEKSTSYDATPRDNKPLSNLGPAGQPMRDVDSRKQGISNPTHFDANPNEPIERSYWQLYNHFTTLFEPSALPLTGRSVDGAVARALQIIDPPTRAKVRSLALAVCTHWLRMQFRYKDADVYGPEMVALVSRIALCLGQTSVSAQKDFSEDLGCACVERLKQMWRWYVDVVSRKPSPMTRGNMFMRVMTVVAMIGYLFHGNQLRHDTVLDGLGYIAAMSPRPDAVAIVCAFLDRLGPRFVVEQTGWYFVQCLLAELSSLTVDRVPVDPLCQLVSAIKVLVAEWQHGTRVMLYDSCPIGNPKNNQLHGHHSQV